MRILVVKNSPSEADYLQRVLSEQGHDVCIAHSSHEAVDSIQKHKPRIIITDTDIPDVEEYEFCGEIQADTELEQISPALVSEQLPSVKNERDVVFGLSFDPS